MNEYMTVGELRRQLAPYSSDVPVVFYDLPPNRVALIKDRISMEEIFTPDPQLGWRPCYVVALQVHHWFTPKI
jgi:hypothetical protein